MEKCQQVGVWEMMERNMLKISRPLATPGIDQICLNKTNHST